MAQQSEASIYAGLTAIFREVFRDPALALTPLTDSREIKGWDSFAQVNIIVAVEERFGVHIRAREAQGLKKVSDLARTVERELG